MIKSVLDVDRLAVLGLLALPLLLADVSKELEVATPENSYKENSTVTDGLDPTFVAVTVVVVEDSI